MICYSITTVIMTYCRSVFYGMVFTIPYVKIMGIGSSYIGNFSQQEGQYNYAKEEITLGIQSQLLSERKVTELKCSRTINATGQKGHNIACDLHMEHLNCQLKRMMANVGSNKLQQPFLCIAKYFGIVSQICSNFISKSDITVSKPHHTYPSFNKDLDAILKELRSEGIFSVEDKRKLTTFKRQPILQSVKWKNVEEWAKKIINFDNFSL